MSSQVLVRIEGTMVMGPPVDQKPPSPEVRRVIQITSGSDTNPVVALCNDSSMWVYNKADSIWSVLPDVPQD